MRITMDVSAKLTLKDLLPAVSGLDLKMIQSDRPLYEVAVSQVTSSESELVADGIFVAFKGSKFDPHLILDQIAQRRPAAILIEKDLQRPKNFSGVFCRVPSGRRALAELAQRWHGDPSRKILCFGVTGTNGKTTSVYLLEEVLNFAGISTGVIGTIDHHFRSSVWPTRMTTPGPMELQGRISEMFSLGAKALALEVTSHGLAQDRVWGCHFNAVLFTNLSRDHLDYHSSMQEYFRQKQKLFTDVLWSSRKAPVFAVVNRDDEWGRSLMVAAKAGVLTYGECAQSDLRFTIIKQDLTGTDFRVITPEGTFLGHIPLLGKHNVQNAVGVLGLAACAGVSFSTAMAALARVKGVPGRMERIENSRGLHIFVDFAHTPDGLEQTLSTLRSLLGGSTKLGNSGDSEGDGAANSENLGDGAAKIVAEERRARLYVVFGCGGDRDKGKRASMGKVADTFADVCILTNDNPRSEEPRQIAADIQKGFNRLSPRVLLDRRLAIAEALEQMRPGDVLLVAGRGHEAQQIFRDERVDFLDSAVTRQLLNPSCAVVSEAT